MSHYRIDFRFIADPGPGECFGWGAYVKATDTIDAERQAYSILDRHNAARRADGRPIAWLERVTPCHR